VTRWIGDFRRVDDRLGEDFFAEDERALGRRVPAADFFAGDFLTDGRFAGERLVDGRLVDGRLPADFFAPPRFADLRALPADLPADPRFTPAVRERFFLAAMIVGLLSVKEKLRSRCKKRARHSGQGCFLE
jgi:hypothetical protein